MGYHAGPADFIQPQHDAADQDVPAACWTWKPAPEPAPGTVPPPRRAWESSRHSAYQAQLASHAVGETFGRTTSFLTQVWAAVSSAAPSGALTAP